ncbi:hypothetical protein RJ640_001557, partial [Escallonia rubra]
MSWIRLNVLSRTSDVVIMAERMAAGVHSGCAPFKSAATPAACGHDMDVPDNKLNFVCDALYGWFARKFNQVLTFGAVLDMVTGRCFFHRTPILFTSFCSCLSLQFSLNVMISTACLLVILSQVYRPGLVFLSLLALDIASRWLQMYSTFLVGKASHKDVNDSTNWLFKAYYGNMMFMGYYCVACE